MARGRALVSARYIRAAPLGCGTRPLSRLRIGAGVWIIRLCCTSGAVRRRNSTAPRVRSRVRIVTSSPTRGSIRTISTPMPAIGSRVVVIVRCAVVITVAIVSATVCRGVGVVVTCVTVWRPPVATPISKDRARRRAEDESPQVACCVVGSNGAIRISGLGDIGHVVNR